MNIYRNFAPVEGFYAAAIGFFDGVHRGHRYLLQHLRDEAHRHGLLSAVVTFSNHPRRLVQPDFRLQFIDTLDERLQKLDEAGIDACFLLDFTEEMRQQSARDFLTHTLGERLHVRRLLIGYDHRFGHGRTEGFDDYVAYGRACGMDVVLEPQLPGVDGCSSSEVRRLLAEGDVAGATVLLGAPYRLTGVVGHGQQLGRQLGFPTANVEPLDPDKLLPAIGVYAAQALVRVSANDAQEPCGTTDGATTLTTYRAMVNIGCRPTVHNGSHLTIEAHLLDFHGDLYGQLLTLCFERRIRDERRMPSLDALKAQIQQDIAALE